jgi:hypothetical protein
MHDAARVRRVQRIGKLNREIEQRVQGQETGNWKLARSFEFPIPEKRLSTAY